MSPLLHDVLFPMASAGFLWVLKEGVDLLKSRQAARKLVSDEQIRSDAALKVAELSTGQLKQEAADKAALDMMSAMQEQLDKQRTELERLGKEVTRLKSTNINDRRTNRDLRATIRRLEAENTRLINDKTIGEEDCKKRIAEMQAQIDELKAKVEHLPMPDGASLQVTALVTASVGEGSTPIPSSKQGGETDLQDGVSA